MDPAPREARARLDDLMEQRRLELGLSWRDVALRAGVAYETVRAARASEGGISSLTASGLERALGWQAGSVTRILDGGEPVTVRQSAGSAAIGDDDPVLERVRNLPGISRQDREALEYVARSPGLGVAMRDALVGWVLAVWEQDAGRNNRPA